MVSGSVQSEAFQTGTTRLSEREGAVLGLMAAGQSDKEIARELFIAERTVRCYLTSIFNELGADNRPHAVLLSAR